MLINLFQTLFSFCGIIRTLWGRVKKKSNYKSREVAVEKYVKRPKSKSESIFIYIFYLLQPLICSYFLTCSNTYWNNHLMLEKYKLSLDDIFLLKVKCFTFQKPHWINKCSMKIYFETIFIHNSECSNTGIIYLLVQWQTFCSSFLRSLPCLFCCIFIWMCFFFFFHFELF